MAVDLSPDLLEVLRAKLSHLIPWAQKVEIIASPSMRAMHARRFTVAAWREIEFSTSEMLYGSPRRALEAALDPFYMKVVPAGPDWSREDD